jgi:hypothetical protein
LDTGKLWIFVFQGHFTLIWTEDEKEVTEETPQDVKPTQAIRFYHQRLVYYKLATPRLVNPCLRQLLQTQRTKKASGCDTYHFLFKPVIDGHDACDCDACFEYIRRHVK